MPRMELPPIVKTAERMVAEIEQAVSRFPRRHKYQHGAVLRTAATRVLQLALRAWRDRAQQLRWTTDLVWAVDELRASLQVGKLLQAFASWGEFERLARTLDELGRQVGGWRKQQHAKRLNPTPPQHAAPERTHTLSAHAASPFEAHP